MGFVKVRVTIFNLAERDKSCEIECLVDTGSIHSLLPKSILKQIEVKPTRERRFTVADGRKIKRKIGDVFFRIGKCEGAAPVIFGNKGDKPLLGITALEALGLEVDPISGRLKPMELLILRFQGGKDEIFGNLDLN